MAGRLDALVNALLGQTGLTLESQVVLASTVGSGRIPRLFMIEGEYALHAWEAELVWTRRTMAEIRDCSLVLAAGRTGPQVEQGRGSSWAKRR